MTKTDDLVREIEALQDRLSKLSEANRRINESLDLADVLREVLESARLLTDARCGIITVLDEAGQVAEFLSSGLTGEESKRLWELPEGQFFFDYLSGIPVPLRVRDSYSHTSSQGFAKSRMLEEVAPILAGPLSFLAAPIRYHGEGLGYIFLARKGSGQAFSRADEETLVMFASQAALVITNARRYREEQRARTGGGGYFGGPCQKYRSEQRQRE